MYIFDEFFSSGFEESVSPFLTNSSKKWAKNLSLKGAILAALLLLLANFLSGSLSSISLLFVYCIAGTPALIKTIKDLKNFELNIDSLMTIAAFLSVAIGSGVEGGLLLVLFYFSSSMESSVSAKTKGTLHALTSLSPTMATVIDGDQTYQKSVREIDVGTTILVQAGEMIPLDGSIAYGTSSVNLVHLTGESRPLGKSAGDEVQAGSHNLDGTLTILVSKKSSESTLSRIIALVEKAQASKPKLARFIDRFGKRYATTVLLLFFLFAIGIPLVTSLPYLGDEGGIYRSLTFLIAASPCALIIATPTAYLSAINACARSGILLKGGVMLDALSKCKKIAFDKTGTLTTGKLSLLSDITDKELAVAAALERHSSHPIATAIVQLAEKRNIAPAELTGYKVVPGYGVTSKNASIGNWEHGDIEDEESITYLMINGKQKKLLFRDEIREEMDDTLQELSKQGYSLTMLTGDHEKSASRVAQKLNLKEKFANLRPDHKLDIISKFAISEGIAMVGDGINDAPALARASVGISMGKIGSGAAIEASDVVILQDDLSKLPWLFKKAKKTSRIVRQNVILSLSVILLATTPALLGLIPLWLAVILHEGGTLIVGLNSLRLLKK